MPTRRTATLEDLRRAVEALPRQTRVAMLQGIGSGPIIVGAYATAEGICPMLAAHRAGGRTSAISFAQAWDRVAFRNVRWGRGRGARARRATERELLILRSHLEASLLYDEAAGCEPEPAVPDPPHRTRPGDPDRACELRDRPGWAWTPVVRRYDDYERVLAALERTRTAVPAATP